ncbi:MAG: indolepyruvate ferredoxin oxidoreductase [Deltaproteobacteria bacterium]|nr:MAG: indolepyruvate ferredoxin oxidoreductase [Deltaproteobacteria bacterium]
MSAFTCPYNLIIAGVGGQGNVLISQLIARAFIRKGYRAIVGETYGVSQRGGSVMSHVRILEKGDIGPIIPAGHGDLVVGLEPMETLRILKTYGNPDIHVITNTRPISPVDVIAGNLAYPDLPAIFDAIRELSKKAWIFDASALAIEIGNPLLTNMVMVGAMIGSGIVPLTLEDFVVILKTYTKAEGYEANRLALQKGITTIKETE